MAKIKNISGEDRRVRTPQGPLVIAGANFEVKPEEVYGFTCQVTNWEPADAEAKKAHNEAHAAYEAAIAAHLENPYPTADDEATEAEEPVEEPTTESTSKTSKKEN